ncbi:hypothetical protein [Granulicella paludicola]|uniref:hypothetical protein n=1 Tax=Granulicella paludicola TaxID=474951 RepID=UPI0021DFFCD8|nr:hypothetical protein [Granulicella paludicola]
MVTIPFFAAGDMSFYPKFLTETIQKACEWPQDVHAVNLYFLRPVDPIRDMLIALKQ